MRPSLCIILRLYPFDLYENGFVVVLASTEWTEGFSTYTKNGRLSHRSTTLPARKGFVSVKMV